MQQKLSTFTSHSPFTFCSGESIPEFTLVYEQYGELNANGTNAILVCPALTADHHAAGHSADTQKSGWFDPFIGPAKALDTNSFAVFCVSNLGSCFGSTGPRSINPKNGQPYANDFPAMQVRDIVMAQHLLFTHLGLPHWYAVVGGSLGGMQALQWALDYPEATQRLVLIATAANLSTQNIAFNEVARQAILADTDYHQGQYQKKQTIPAKGLGIARMLGHVTYLSDKGLLRKFGRTQAKTERKNNSLSFHDIEFAIESYLHYQSNRFSLNFDANTYLLYTRILDSFDPAIEYGSFDEACSRIKAKVLVISFSSDWRFSPERSMELVQAMLRKKIAVSYVNIQSDYGHDAFLIENREYSRVLFGFLNAS